MEKLMTPKEVAQFLGYSASWLARSRVEGYGPKYIKLNHRVGYRPRDVEQWVDERVRSSTSEY